MEGEDKKKNGKAPIYYYYEIVFLSLDLLKLEYFDSIITHFING